MTAARTFRPARHCGADIFGTANLRRRRSRAAGEDMRKRRAALVNNDGAGRIRQRFLRRRRDARKDPRRRPRAMNIGSKPPTFNSAALVIAMLHPHSCVSGRRRLAPRAAFPARQPSRLREIIADRARSSGRRRGRTATRDRFDEMIQPVAIGTRVSVDERDDFARRRIDSRVARRARDRWCSTRIARIRAASTISRSHLSSRHR